MKALLLMQFSEAKKSERMENWALHSQNVLLAIELQFLGKDQ